MLPAHAFGGKKFRYFISILSLCSGPRVGGGGVLPENLGRVCGPLPKTLTLFMTKICDFPYPIYDLTKKLDTLFLLVACFI